jgi:flagellar basal-body rod modification protein FlgD
MLTNSISNNTPVTNSQSSSSTISTANVSAEQSQFMTLLVAQMRNQDPLNPMDNNEMTSQIAMLNMVSGIDNLNKTLNNMSTSQRLGDSLKATDLIGHSVLVPTSKLVLNNGVSDFSVDLASDAQNVNVMVLDKYGSLVKSFDMGAQTAGIHKIIWDGFSDTGSQLADGEYSIKVDAQKNGQMVDATSLTADTVDNLTLSGGLATLQLSKLGNVGLSDIRAVY